jgi:hypothetical protein
MPEILRSLPLADEILESHRQLAHGDEAGYDAYKAHVYRVVNFARALTPHRPDRDDKLAIAAAFHDLAPFDTLDYLVPSIEAQDAWLQETGRENWSDELALIVAEHHRLSRYGAGTDHQLIANLWPPRGSIGCKRHRTLVEVPEQHFVVRSDPVCVRHGRR